MRNSSLFFNKGEVPLRIEFIPYTNGNASIDDNVVKSPDTLLLVEVTFFDSRKTLGLNKKEFDNIKKLDETQIVPVRIFFDKLIQECIKDLENKGQMSSEKTLSKYSEYFFDIINKAIEEFLNFKFD